MDLLRESIRKHLLVEKTIAQIVSNLEVTFNLEVDRGAHGFARKDRKELEGKGYELTGKHSYEYNQREVSNGEIKEVINLAKKEIAEKIVNGEIENNVPFVIKSIDRNLAAVIDPNMESNLYWKLIVVTVFREDEDNRLKTFKGQVVIRK